MKFMWFQQALLRLSSLFFVLILSTYSCTF